VERDASIFEAEVTHLSNQGYGVVKGPHRITYFVRGTWRGDVGRFQSTDERDGDYQFAELLTLVRPSPERQNPPCRHLGPGASQCFGCPWMMVDYVAQLREKQHRVSYALARVGLDSLPMETIWPSPDLYHYRRRAQFKTDGQTLGYSGRQGLCIAPIEECLVLTPRMQGHLQDLRARLPDASWQPGPGYIWNYLDLDEDSDPQDFQINRRRPFQQANAKQNEAMRSWVAERLNSKSKSEPVLELFAGAGNFTEVLVSLGFSRILALEVGAEAIESLQQKNWQGVAAERMDLYNKQALPTLAYRAADARIMLANPPRAGLGILWKLVPRLPALHTVVMISCDPQSFANDARKLIESGFKASIIQALDQMPHTPHVEVIALFERDRPGVHAL
jgi:23S rRNA (uracil1939-C5)-methyltransferase